MDFLIEISVLNLQEGLNWGKDFNIEGQVRHVVCEGINGLLDLLRLVNV